MLSEEARIREDICRFGRSLFERGLTSGSSGHVTSSSRPLSAPIAVWHAWIDLLGSSSTWNHVLIASRYPLPMILEASTGCDAWFPLISSLLDLVSSTAGWRPSSIISGSTTGGVGVTSLPIILFMVISLERPSAAILPDPSSPVFRPTTVNP